MSTRQDSRSTKWDRYRDLIISLSHDEDWSFSHVAEFLKKNTELTDANERKVRLHLERWKIRKKLHEPWVAAALHILANSGLNRQGMNPHFRFGNSNRTVSLQRLLDYLDRKGVEDPFGWLASRPPVTSEDLDDVRLLIEKIPSVSSASDDHEFLHVSVTDSLITHQMYDDQPSRDQVAGTDALITSQQQYIIGMEIDRLRPLSQELSTTEQILCFTGSYCRAYLDSPREGSEVEPLVHMQTRHGRFGSMMQEGIYQCIKYKEINNPKIRSAFVMAESLVRAEHPMRMAQLFAIVSELLGKSSRCPGTQVAPVKEMLDGATDSLVRQMLNFSETYLGSNHALTVMFRILVSSTNQQAYLVIKVMKRMLDIFKEEGPDNDWREMYLMERYADCLYHAGVQGERYALRAQLLDMQTGYYGAGRSNVLYTLTNVADDYLEKNQPEEAEAKFEQARRLADEHLDAYAKAKLRYVAFTGLARSTMMKLEMAERRARKLPHLTHGTTRVVELQKVHYLLCQAQEEADAWFPETRRALSVRHWADNLSDEIESLQTQSGVSLSGNS